MRAWTMTNVIHISIVLAPILLHHNNVGVTYPKTSNLRMEPVKFYTIIFYGNASIYGYSY
jgi:hypothetical protein